MKVYVEKKPVVVKADSKDSLLDKIRERFRAVYGMSSYGNGFSTLSHDTYVMYNAQKFRRKRGVRKGYWVAYIYKFEEDFLRAANLYVEQGNRTFTIKARE
jgi:hypothetical protein